MTLALNGLGSLFMSSLHFLLHGINKWKSRHCSVRTVISGNSPENVNESLIRSRSVHGNCESFAEKSRSEQMKCLQIARTESYTWKLSTGWFHLGIHKVTKDVGGKGKKSKQDFTTKESKSRKYRAKLGSAVRIPGIIPRWTGKPRFRFPFSCPLHSEMFNHRIFRLVGTHEGLWSQPLSS